ncbi:MAG: segregation/condensation protein A [Clostridioides sp.]|jgi:segregation and condensation protein A|nr:segregation/condensation protein A [Clostridioides sp.]
MNTEYSIQINSYEGPLDLLCDLVYKKKIEIKDISIVEITNQYLDYISKMQKMDLDIASEFISMASKLLEIKSKYLLYSNKKFEEELEEDPSKELFRQLEEYKKFKDIAEEISKNICYVSERFFRNAEEIFSSEEVCFDELSVENMENIYQILQKNKNEETDIELENIDKGIDIILNEKVISIEEKADYIRQILLKRSSVEFSNIVRGYDNNEIVATFLSLLELIKQKEVIVEQKNFLTDILIETAI